MFLTGLNINLFLSTFQQWDRAGFIRVNTEFISTWADFLLPVLREPKTWIPLYLFLLVWALIKFKTKAIPWILAALLCVLMTDQISSHFLKNYFGRIRPCSEPSLENIRRLLVDYCPKSGSFPSSHAVNHFGIGTFFFFTLKKHFKSWGYLFFFWAAAIAYAQVYVGVHYPSDVIGGAILGILLGLIPTYLFQKYFGWP